MRSMAAPKTTARGGARTTGAAVSARKAAPAGNSDWRGGRGGQAAAKRGGRGGQQTTITAAFASQVYIYLVHIKVNKYKVVSTSVGIFSRLKPRLTKANLG
jgi:hypothetical protein